jgi:hypothetical protein
VISAWLRRGFLIVVGLLLAGCSDLDLRRGAAAPADTTPEQATSSRSRAPERKAGRATAEATSFAALRRTLRRLVAAEETFFAENGTYSDDSSLIGGILEPDVSIRFFWLSRDGWAASATHPALPGRDCVTFGGQGHAPPTTLKYVRSGRPGVPVCDDHSPPRKPLAAEPPNPAPPNPDAADPVDLLDPRVVMKVDLRNLAHSQETYVAMHGFFARRTEALALQYLWHPDVMVRIIEADAQSWAARATHSRFPGKSCVIWFGAVSRRPATDAQRREAARAGEPVCD